MWVGLVIAVGQTGSTFGLPRSVLPTIIAQSGPILLLLYSIQYLIQRNRRTLIFMWNNENIKQCSGNPVHLYFYIIDRLG